ncbi:hypothetical protein Pcinc_010015 [Petrolisthes cinctipes]|uniref:Innexin n=1 Tax=Petrolisthes cinctipes TaxID=88211 RepID=A0AAE1G9W3_PETCI|nr:hypothetical protein Pcinc_010015 [Petrolisthes cinctipes]
MVAEDSWDGKTRHHIKMVLGVLGALVGMTKVHYSRTAVDSWTFRLHYRATTTFCLVAAALVTAADFVGKPIQCLVGYKSAPKPITTYCWISSSFTINSTSPIPGIGPVNKYHEQTFHAYYQWVTAVLFIQAFLFYLPHFIWKNLEGKQVDLLLQDLNKKLIDDDSKRKRENILKYLKDSWGLNIKYSIGYSVCEILNLVNVVGQMFLIDKFLGGIFFSYGTKVFSLLSADDGLRSDPVIETFPRVTKCTFWKYGTSGTPVQEDALCVLPQNIINEKIYFIMWLWFIILTIISTLQIIWRLVLYSSSYLRVRLLSHRAKMPASLKLEQTVRLMHLGDYCLLDSIGRNLDPLNFRNILDGVTKAAEEVVATDPVMDSYRPLYPSPEVETLPRKRHIDQPDSATVIQ